MSSGCRPPRGLGEKNQKKRKVSSMKGVQSAGQAVQTWCLGGWRAAGETGSGELQHHRNMKAPTSWRGFLLAGAGLLDGGRQRVSEGGGAGRGGGGVRGCRVQAEQHSLVGKHAQRDISNSEVEIGTFAAFEDVK